MTTFSEQWRDLRNPIRRAAALRAASAEVDRVQSLSKSMTREQSANAYADVGRVLDEADRLNEQQKSAQHRYGPLAGGGGMGSEDTAPTTKRIGRVELPSPAQLPASDWRDAYDAVRSRKAWRGEVTTKAAIGGIGLPAVVDPSLTQGLPTEPDRLFAHFPSKSTDAPIVEYYTHTGNANPAAVVAELGAKPDLGMQLVARTASVTKIAALASVSMEALHDFSTFEQFVPGELQRAVIDAETHWVATQLLGISGTLTLARGANEAPLDTISEAFDALRVGSAFAVPNLVAMHPTTWGYLRRQKDTQGRYLLAADPATGQIDTIWGVRVVINTTIPVGTAFVVDTSCVLGWTRQGLTIESNGYSDTDWTHNSVSFRCEERIAIGALKPAGINVVTGLVAS